MDVNQFNGFYAFGSTSFVLLAYLHNVNAKRIFRQRKVFSTE
jgi:hypothetical protein